MVKDIGRLLAEEAEAAEGHRDDDVPLVRSRRPAREPAQVYSLRVPVEKLEELRRLAGERHLTPSALMRSRCRVITVCICNRFFHGSPSR